MKKFFFLVALVAVLLVAVFSVVLVAASVDVPGVATAVAPVVTGISTFNPALAAMINNILLAGVLIFQALKYFFPKM